MNIIPYPNYHSCRRLDPKRCTNYRTIRGEINGKPVKLRKALDAKGNQVIQSILFPVEHWSASQARAACRKGTFHPASGVAEKVAPGREPLFMADLGAEKCICRRCRVLVSKPPDTPCSALTCPECGKPLEAHTTYQEEE